VEDMEDPVAEMIEEVEEDKTTRVEKIATADVVDGKNCKT